MDKKIIAMRLLEKNVELVHAKALIQDLQAQLRKRNSVITKLEIALISSTLDEEAKKNISTIEGIDASNGVITLLLGKEAAHLTYSISKDLPSDFLFNALAEMVGHFGFSLVPTTDEMADTLLKAITLPEDEMADALLKAITSSEDDTDEDNHNNDSSLT